MFSTSLECYNADDSSLTKRIRFSVSSTSTEESENDSDIDPETMDLYQTQRTIFEGSGVMGYNRGAAYSTKISYLNDSLPLGGSSPSWPDSTADVRFQSKLTPQVLYVIGFALFIF